MKFIQAATFLSVLSPTWGSIASVRASSKTEPMAGRKLSIGATTCNLVKADMYLEGDRTKEIVGCDIPAADLSFGEGFKMVEVNFLPQHVIDGIESGETTLVATNAVLDVDKNELIVPAGATYEVDINITARGRRRLSTMGAKKVLVVRETRTESSEEVISDKVFGTDGDTVHLSSQYSACSYDQLTFSKYEGNSKVKNGVLTVSVSENPSGSDNGVIRNAMINAASSTLGTNNLSSLADYVMLCIPPGTNGGWIAYAYINFWLSVYNNKWCNFPSGQMHELGHNLNMAHAGEGSGQYADQSGMMGYSYANDDTTMCFNGPKTYQFGWFSEFHQELSGDSIYWTGDLVGFAERGDLTGSGPDRMIIKISTKDGSDPYFVHFNRMISFNIGTKEGQDQVLVARRADGTGYAQSWLEDKLSAGAVYTKTNFQGGADDLTITVNSIDRGTPRRARVTIKLGSIPETPAPIAPTIAPVAPTVAPVAPTLAPVAPTVAPIAPTLAPIAPTAAPVVPQTPDWRTCDDKPGVFLDNSDTERTCNWLRYRKVNTINRLCAATEVASLCPKTCDMCSDDCQDDMESLFQINNQVGEQNCWWIARSATSVNTYCHAGHPAFYYCRETCESCDEKFDTFPSSAPSVAIDPLADGECKDNDDTPFPFGKNERRCPWLRKNPEKKEILCVSGEPAYYACEETCNRCVGNDCDDDAEALFQIDNKIGEKTCGWVANSSERIAEYCHTDHPAFYHCRDTCNSCDEQFDNFPSAAPSVAVDPLADGECKDDDAAAFMFGAVEKYCPWLRKNPDKQEKLCVPRESAYYVCEATCKRCIREITGTCNSNGICEANEDCESCPSDCRARYHATNGFCCVGGECGHKACNRSAKGIDWQCEIAA